MAEFVLFLEVERSKKSGAKFEILNMKNCSNVTKLQNFALVFQIILRNNFLRKCQNEFANFYRFSISLTMKETLKSECRGGKFQYFLIFWKIGWKKFR